MYVTNSQEQIEKASETLGNEYIQFNMQFKQYYNNNNTPTNWFKYWIHDRVMFDPSYIQITHTIDNSMSKEALQCGYSAFINGQPTKKLDL